MKKIFLTIITILLVVSFSVMLFGCGKDTNENNENVTENEAEENSENEENEENEEEQNVNTGFDFTLINNDTQYEVKLASGNADASITIPSTHNGKAVTKIKGMGFYNNANITSVTIPDSITVIDFEAFKNCTNLTSVTIPANVTLIDEDAFYGCTSLASVTFNEGLLRISGHAFRNTALTNIVLPSTIEIIGAACFKSYSLSTVTILATTPPEQYGQAFNTPIDTITVSIFVPAASVADYVAHSSWSTYASSISGIVA